MFTTTFYLLRINPKTGKTGDPCGTGVFIGVPSEKFPEKMAVYAVTAKHAIDKGASIIRINAARQLPGQAEPDIFTRPLEFEPHEWSFIPGGDDVAAIEVTSAFNRNDLIRTVPIFDLATPAVVKTLSITAGEDIFMLGLFTDSPGVSFNSPCARFGNLSQIAHPDHPIKQGHGFKHPSHITDMHSRPGFSGSPVFIYRTPDQDLVRIAGARTDKNAPTPTAFVKLLGIHSAQFKERAETAKGTKLTIPSSMAIIVPAEAVEKLLNSPRFVEARRMRDREHTRMTRDDPQVQAEIDSTEPAADNPVHKEDFISLVSAAAKKRPQAG